MQYYSLKITEEDWKLHYATGVDGIEVVLWELFAADVEGIESICAVGTMFEEDLKKYSFGLCDQKGVSRKLQHCFQATHFHLCLLHWSSGLWLKKLTVLVNSVMTCWRFGFLVTSNSFIVRRMKLAYCHNAFHIQLSFLPSFSRPCHACAAWPARTSEGILLLSLLVPFRFSFSILCKNTKFSRDMQIN